MNRRLVLAIVVGVALAATVASALLPQWDPNAFVVLAYLELLVPIVGLVAGLRYLVRHRDRAAEMLGVAIYALALGIAFVVLTFVWFPTDNAGLGMLLLGGLTIVLGIGLALACSLALISTHRWHAVARPLGLGVVGTLFTLAVLLLRGREDWASSVYSVKLYSFPVMVMSIAISLAILDLARPGRVMSRRDGHDGMAVAGSE